MRIQFLHVIASVAILLNFQESGATLSGASREVTIGLSDVFVPSETKSETEAFVVVSGVFPNGCYRWKGAEVKHITTYQHEVKSKALVSQGMCIMVLIPYTKEIRLGNLARGEHKVRFVNGDGTYLERNMTVQ